MFFTTRKPLRTSGRTGGRPARRRARDGYQLQSSSQRRRVRKASGLSSRQQRRVVKSNRAYRKGRRSHRGRLF